MAEDEQNETPLAGQWRLHSEALHREMTTRFEELQQTIADQMAEQFRELGLGNGRGGGRGRGNRGRGRGLNGGRGAELYSDIEDDYEQPYYHDVPDDSLQGLKYKIPSFDGKADPGKYLAWEMKMNQIFSVHNYSDAKKAKIATLEFTDYAMSWWHSFQENRRRRGEPPITSWTLLTEHMRMKWVPNHYFRDQGFKLQQLTQAGKSVEEFHEEMQSTIVRANIHEPEDVTMQRFLCGLRDDIAGQVELQNYQSLSDMVNGAIMVERRLKARREERNKANKPFGYRSSFTPSIHQGGATIADSRKIEGGGRPNVHKNKLNEILSPNKVPKADVGRSRDINCFKCKGKRHYTANCPSI